MNYPICLLDVDSVGLETALPTWSESTPSQIISNQGHQANSLCGVYPRRHIIIPMAGARNATPARRTWQYDDLKLYLEKPIE